MTAAPSPPRQTETAISGAQLENEIEQEYEATHDGESATKEYLDSEVARRLADLNGTATPETAAA